jgi:hypothetical protein
MKPYRAWLAAYILLLVAGLSPVRAADTETRDFAITIDKKQAGSYQLTVATQDDGTVTAAAQASVRLNYFIKVYTYSYRGTEVWKNGRLVQLDSTSDDDGKRYTVAVRPDATGLRVQVNGQDRQSVRPDVWLSTYWRLPDAKYRNQPVPLLDADTGKDLHAQLHFVAEVQKTIAGQTMNCTHYRLTGDVKVDLWYDAQERMVRQEAIEDGHRTVLELVRIRR